MRHQLLLLLSLTLLTGKAFGSFDFNPSCREIYKETIHFQLDQARKNLDRERIQHPENDLVCLLENYIDYFYLLSSDDKEAFDRQKKQKGRRLDRLSAGDPHSPYYLFAQAQVNLQWALLRGRYQEYVGSAMDMKKAFHQFQENRNKFPDFKPNEIGLGMLNAILGSLPSSAQTLLGTFGVRGQTALGERLLENATKSLLSSPYAFFYEESVFYLSQVWVNISKKKGAFESVLKLTSPMQGASLLRTYIEGYAAFKTGHTDEAITFLTAVSSEQGRTAYPYLDYLLGMSRLHQLDLRASQDLLRFIKNTKGQAFVKDCYLHLGYIALLKGDDRSYQFYVAQVKRQGATYEERDKQALSEANAGAPRLSLLKARFLFDGGYYQRTKSLLEQENANAFKQKRDQVEYCYRLARVYDETGGVQGATKFYQYTIRLGKDQKYYYAANASLLLGDLYARKGQYPLAAHCYQQAIDMKNHDYESSIENKAKEGLKRIAGKY